MSVSPAAQRDLNGQAGQSYKPTWPMDQELVVVASEDCRLRLGERELALVPARVILPILDARDDFVAVEYQGSRGWLRLADCFRIASNPVAESECRTGLALLARDDLLGARIRLFIAAALDPDDDSYEELLTYLAEHAKSLDILLGLCDEHQELVGKARRTADAFSFAQGAGFSEKTLANARIATTQQKWQELAQMNAEHMMMSNKVFSTIENFSQATHDEVERLAGDGLYHMALALWDFRRRSLGTLRFTVQYGREDSQKTAEYEKMRRCVSDSNRHWEEGRRAQGDKKLLKANSSFELSLKTWPKNKLAIVSRANIAPAVARIEELMKRVRAISDGSRSIDAKKIAEMEELAKEVRSLTTDADGLEAMLQRAHTAFANPQTGR